MWQSKAIERAIFYCAFTVLLSVRTLEHAAIFRYVSIAINVTITEKVAALV